MSDVGPKRKRTKLWWALGAGSLFCVWGGCLPALHNFGVFGARARAAEARTHVKALCVGQLLQGLLVPHVRGLTLHGLCG